MRRYFFVDHGVGTDDTSISDDGSFHYFAVGRNPHVRANDNRFGFVYPLLAPYVIDGMRVAGTYDDVIGYHAVVAECDAHISFLGVQVNVLCESRVAAYGNLYAVSLHPETAEWTNVAIVTYLHDVVASHDVKAAMFFNPTVLADFDAVAAASNVNGHFARDAVLINQNMVVPSLNDFID